MTATHAKQPSYAEVLRTTLRILTFRARREELVALGHRHLVFGLLCTWLVGIGRWWDDPGASPLLHTGLGSVVYVFALSLLLWLIAWPLRPEDWSYRNVLTYVSLTAPPAILYAIPVERWFGLDAAAQVNVWFLLVVAVWRVALLVVYLKRLAKLRGGRAAVAVLLPIMGIITVLTRLNLHQVVFNLMGGLRERTAHDDVYLILLGLTLLSVYGLIPVLIWYGVQVLWAWKPPEE